VALAAAPGQGPCSARFRRWLRAFLGVLHPLALCGYRSWGRSLGRAIPLIQARPVCR
jgi:hypothetical protein